LSKPALRLAGAVAALVIQPPAMSRAGENAEICRRHEVVEFVSAAIRSETAYALLDPSSIGERPTPNSSAVLCSALVLRWEYDYTRFRRMTWLEYREYVVKKLAHGYEVNLDR
jgi:hypothetical protein